MYFRLTASTLYTRFALWLGIFLAMGYFLNNLLLFAFLYLLVIVCWQFNHILKLADWLLDSKALNPPLADGIFGRIFDALHRQRRIARQKQKRLNDRIKRFRDGSEAMPDATLVLSNDFTIEWGNKKAQKLLGIKPKKDIGQRIDNLIRFPAFSEKIANRELDTPIDIPSPLNPEARLEIRLMSYGNDQILFLARDISKLHRLEEMRRDFVANVSHELKTPLTVVRGYIEMIQATEHGFDPHWSKAFNTIEGQVTRMDRLVEQLLTLSKVEISNEHEQSFKQPIDMPALLKQLVEDASWLNQEKMHKLNIDISENYGIYGIDTEIKSACSNLITNAIAYTPNQGEIDISWKLIGDKLQFSVKDNGPGIKPQHVNRLTERFYRVDKSRSRNTGGSGLGLAIVKHVLQHHNAELTISSQWGKGSEFSITFDTKSLCKLT